MKRFSFVLVFFLLLSGCSNQSMQLEKQEIGQITFAFAEEVYSNASNLTKISETLLELANNPNVLKDQESFLKQFAVEDQEQMIYRSVEKVVLHRLNTEYNEPIARRVIETVHKQNQLLRNVSIYLTEEKLEGENTKNELQKLQQNIEGLLPLLYPRDDIHDDDTNLYNVIAYSYKFKKGGELDQMSNEGLKNLLDMLDTRMNEIITFLDDHTN